MKLFDIFKKKKEKKPKIIIELEKELNCEFELVNLSEIVWGNRSYSVDKTANITGISIGHLNLNEIPKTISKNIDLFLNLIIFDLVGNQIRDFSCLRNLKFLNTLDLGYNQISDISFLNLPQISILSLAGNELIEINSISQLKKLKKLDLNHNQIIEINVFKELQNLECLELEGNQIKDFSVLKELLLLKDLNLSYNEI